MSALGRRAGMVLLFFVVAWITVGILTLIERWSG